MVRRREGLAVFGALSRWLKTRTARREAVASAVRHFEATGRRAHNSLCSVIGAEARGIVVRVCHGDVKPPGRTWFVVGPCGVVAELDWADAKGLGERAWR